jgi:hypothetical protein
MAGCAVLARIVMGLIPEDGALSRAWVRGFAGHCEWNDRCRAQEWVCRCPRLEAAGDAHFPVRDRECMGPPDVWLVVCSGAVLHDYGHRRAAALAGASAVGRLFHHSYGGLPLTAEASPSTRGS